MRALRYIQTMILILIGFQLFGQSIMTDTIFFHQDSVLGSRQSIFIDYDTNNIFYDRISIFSFGRFDNQSYDYSIKYLNDNDLILTVKSNQQFNMNIQKSFYSPAYGQKFENNVLVIHVRHSFKKKDNVQIITKIKPLKS